MPAAGGAGATRRGGDLERLLVGPDRRVQAALGALDLTEEMAGRCGQARLAGRPPSGDAGREGALRLGEPAAEPLGQGQLDPSDGVQHPLALAESQPGRATRTRPSPRRRRANRQPGTRERDRRGNVRQPARAPAHRRLEGLIGDIRERTLGGIQRRIGRFHVATDERHPRPRQAQPRPRAGQLGGKRRKPPLNRRAFTRQKERVKVPLDQPRRPAGVAGGQRVAHGVVGQTMFFSTRWPRFGAAPGPGLVVAAAGGRGAGRRTAGGSATSRAPRPAAPGTARQPRSASSIAWPSDRPVTASHSPPTNRSSTEVSSRNSRSCAGWRSSTSSAR